MEYDFRRIDIPVTHVLLTQIYLVCIYQDGVRTWGLVTRPCTSYGARVSTYPAEVPAQVPSDKVRGLSARG